LPEDPLTQLMYQLEPASPYHALHWPREGNSQSHQLMVLIQQFIIKCSDVCDKTDCHGHQVTVFRIPHTKCSKDGEDVYCAAQPHQVNPISELNNQLTVNDPPVNSHLFAYHHSHGHRPLTKCAFMNRINTVATSLSLTSLKGHGVCIRGTLEYLLYGLPFDVMKSMGQWSSKAFTLYLHKHAVIMAPYLRVVLLCETTQHKIHIKVY